MKEALRPLGLHSLPSKAPAVQLQEHAAAIAADDEQFGFERGDAFVKRLARGGANNSVTRLFRIIFLCFATI